jgi:selenide,water dikinase
MPDWRRGLLTVPHTSGGLLVACDAGRAEAVLGVIEEAGYPRTRIISSFAAGKATGRIK